MSSQKNKLIKRAAPKKRGLTAKTMKSKTALLTTLSMAIVLIIIGVMSGADAFGKFDRQRMDSRDYQAWKKMVDSIPRITDVVTEKNFNRFAEMHNLIKEEKFDKASKIAKELNLPDMEMGMGMGMGMGYCRLGHMMH